MKTESEFNRKPLRLSVAAAATMDLSEIDGLSVDDLDSCDADLNRAARVWLWLCDATDGSAETDRLCREVLPDGGADRGLEPPCSRVPALVAGCPLGGVRLGGAHGI
jgi:hypothetical protein